MAAAPTGISARPAPTKPPWKARSRSRPTWRIPKMTAQIITTVVTPATSYDLTTLEEVMDELDLPEVENSTLFGRWITQASKTAAAYCNRVFVVETVKDEFWPQRDPWPWVV